MPPCCDRWAHRPLFFRRCVVCLERSSQSPEDHVRASSRPNQGRDRTSPAGLCQAAPRQPEGTRGHRRARLCRARQRFGRHGIVSPRHQGRIVVLPALRRRYVRDQRVELMRLIGLAALAIAAMAGVWYTSGHRLPYYYDAMIFVLAITGAAPLVDTSSASRSKRPRRIIRDGTGRDARIVYDSHQIVCQIGPWKWDIEEFCTHWFITGDTGAGKTSSGLNKLLISLTEHYPGWGALILDPKGVYWRTVQTMLAAAGRREDLAVLRVRSPQETTQDDHPLRFNLIGDKSVPCRTYAQMIVDAHAAHRAGSAAGTSDFFNQRAMEHISKCFELMRALDLPFNLRTAYTLLVNKDHLKNTLDTLPDHPHAREPLPAVHHF